jgi:hypothetical protein
MKTILSTVLLIALGYSAWAQHSTFVRVYDLAGKKIGKGHVFAVTDTSLQLEAKPTPLNFPVQRIGFIKTKRSGGNNVLIGSAIGVSTLAILSAATAEPEQDLFYDTPAEAAAFGAFFGLPIGAAIGGLTIVFKKSNHYLINGDISKWKVFKLSTTQNGLQ